MEARRGAILIGISAAAFLGPFTQTVYTPSLPELQRYFDVNTVLINLTISLFTAILAVSNFIVGPLADTRGRRAVLLPGLIVFAVGSAVCVASTAYGWFLAGRALQACGISTALLVAPTVIGDVYPPDRRASAMSTYQTVSFLGPVLGPVIGGFIAAYLSWRWAFALLAVAALGAWQYNRVRLPETLARTGRRQAVTVRTFAGVLGNRSALAIVLIGFSQFYGYYVFLVFLPTLLTTLFALSTGVKGLFFVPLTAGILLGLYAGIWWQRRWSRTRILATSSYAMGANVLLLWIALVTGLVTLPVLILFLLGYGVLLGCSLPVQSTILVNLFTKDKGTAVGVYNFLRFTGAAIGPMAGGAVAMAFDVDAVFLNVAILLLVSAVLIGKFLYDPFEVVAS